MPKLDLVLVNPNNKNLMFGELNKFSSSEPPLWTGLLAAYVRSKGFSVKVIDADADGFGPEETVERIIDYNPLVVGVGVVGANPSASSTPKMPPARRILNLLNEKKPDITTVLYGIHPASLPEQTLREETVDFVCQGEILKPMAQLLKDVKAGAVGENCKIKGLWYRKGDEIISNGWAEQESNLDELPFVAWDLLPMDRYKAHTWHCYDHIHERSPYAIIFTSLGCIFHCTYCNIHDLYGEKPGMRFRSPQNVIQEIDYLVKTYHVKNIKFLDELFVIDVSDKYSKRLNKICDLLIERNYDLNIWVYARIDTVTQKILEKLKRAGIRWVAYGIEGGNKEIRTKVSKGQFDSNKITQAVQWTYDAGLYIIGNFMFGLPNDNMETMQETLNLARAINCEYANFYCTMAYPGSKLYEEAVTQGLRLPESWSGYSQYSPQLVPMPTKYLSPEEVLRFRDNAFIEYFSRSEYLTMIERKFGKETLEHIHDMLTYKIERKILREEDKKSVVTM